MPVDRLRKAVEADRRADYREAMGHVRACEEALHADGVPPERPIWGEADVLGSEIEQSLGNTAEARERATRAVKRSQELGWSGVLPKALRALGRIEQRVGDLKRATALLEHALELSRQQGDSAGQALSLRNLAIMSENSGDRRSADDLIERALALVREDKREHATLLNVLGDTRRARGDLVGAQGAYTEARSQFEVQDNKRGLARSLDGLAIVAHQAGRHEEAIGLEERAIALLESMGCMVGVAEGRNLLGDVYRVLKRFEEAEGAYRDALELWDTAGSRGTLVARLNLALTALARGHYVEAESALTEIVDACVTQERRGWEAICRVFLLVPAMAAGRFEAWEVHYGRGAALLVETGEVDRDVAWAARLCATLAEERGEPEDLGRAVRCRAIALDQWLRLGIEDDVRTECSALSDLALRGANYPVGAFDLVGTLGSGGMGDVWRAVHREQGVEVALKVLHAAYIKRRSSFDAEVSAVARLDHPGIVRVLDHGIIGPAAQHMTGGRLMEGAPYFAMEIAQGGTLGELCGKLDWRATRRVLLALLDALAHAHARGVLHLDLKPANVLLDTSTDGSPTVRLTDFGLAGVMVARDQASIVMGTPAYMAPEQFRGARRDFGPWTDLYALGCVAVQLITGSPVFAGDDMAELEWAHTQMEPPPLPAGIQAPPEFEGWIERCLEKSIHGRFRRAADAAFELQRLPEAFAGSLHEVATEVLSMTGVSALGAWTSSDLPARQRTGWTESLPDVPPVPMHWKANAAYVPPLSLSGAGRGLVGVRSVPLVGREREQDQLWSVFRDVVARRHTRVAVLQGTAGVGRTRLANWLAERTHELGVATVVRGAGGEGLRSMMSRFFGCEGLNPAECHGRIQAEIRSTGLAIDVTAMAGFVSGAAALTPEEKTDLVARILGRLSRRRPVVVRLDDALTVEMVALAHRLAGEQASVLVVLTVCDDDRPDHPLASDPLEALLAGDDSVLVELGPLAVEVRQALVQQLLRLEDTLADEVATRTGGNPRFAVQVVGDLVRLDQLVPSPVGFVLRHGARLKIPDDVHETCRAQLERVLREVGRDAVEALAVAAVIGTRVSTDEWLAATSDLASDHALLETLIRHRLVVAEERHWSFANAMLRHTALRMAEDAGTAREARLAVVLMLGQSQPGRRGELLAAAGEWGASVDLLEEGANRRVRVGDFEAAKALLNQREHALDRLGEPSRGLRRIPGMLLRARIDFDTLAYESARQHARRALRSARRLKRPHWTACALQILGHLSRMAGKMDRAEEMFEDALRAFRASADAARAGSCLHGLAEVSLARNDLDRSLGFLRDAVPWLEDADDPELAELVVIGLGRVHSARREFPEAERAFLEALQRAEIRGAHRTAIDALVGLGDLGRARGDPCGATAAYRRAIDLAPAAVSARSMRCRLNLALALLGQESWTEAAEEVAPWVEALERRGRAGLLAFAKVILLAARLEAVAMPGVKEALRRSRLVNVDVAWALELAGGRAAKDDQPDLAIALWTMAGEQYRALEDLSSVARVREAMAICRA